MTPRSDEPIVRCANTEWGGDARCITPYLPDANRWDRHAGVLSSDGAKRSTSKQLLRSVVTRANVSTIGRTFTEERNRQALLLR